MPVSNSNSSDRDRVKELYELWKQQKHHLTIHVNAQRMLSEYLKTVEIHIQPK